MLAFFLIFKRIQEPNVLIIQLQFGSELKNSVPMFKFAYFTWDPSSGWAFKLPSLNSFDNFFKGPAVTNVRLLLPTTFHLILVSYHFFFFFFTGTWSKGAADAVNECGILSKTLVSWSNFGFQFVLADRLAWRWLNSWGSGKGFLWNCWGLWCCYCSCFLL